MKTYWTNEIAHGMKLIAEIVRESLESTNQKRFQCFKENCPGDCPACTNANSVDTALTYLNELRDKQNRGNAHE